jgi:DNA transposition AAA+ family ATPase
MLEALAKYNIKQVDVAREAGIHHSTLSLWLQGKVKGHYIKIEDTLTEWL